MKWIFEKLLFLAITTVITAACTIAIVVFLKAAWHGRTYVSDVPTWHPPILDCPAGMDKWECIRQVQYRDDI